MPLNRTKPRHQSHKMGRTGLGPVLVQSSKLFCLGWNNFLKDRVFSLLILASVTYSIPFWPSLSSLQARRGQNPTRNLHHSFSCCHRVLTPGIPFELFFHSACRFIILSVFQLNKKKLSICLNWVSYKNCDIQRSIEF